MHQVRVKDLKVGDVLAADVSNRSSQVLLAAGTAVDARSLARLKASGVVEVPIRDVESLKPATVQFDSAMVATAPGVQRELLGDHPAVVEMARVIDEFQPPSRRQIGAAVPVRGEAGSDDDVAPANAKWQPLTAEKVVSKIGTLATLPTIYVRVNTIINKPSSSTADIANVLINDQALSARLLRIANSAFYGFSRRVETVGDAVRIMGTRQLHDMVLATVVLKQFKGLDAKLVNMVGFWRHSLACGVMARRIAALRRESNVERFFLAGLLHDIGSLVLYQQQPERCRMVLRIHRHSDRTLAEVEREIIGCDHPAVAKALLSEWRLPSFLRDVVAAHHSPDPQQMTIELAAVHVADIFTLGLGLGSNGEVRPPRLETRAWDMLELSVSALEQIANDTVGLLQEAEKVFLGDEKGT
jgi:HD-like signal output (HDOD) protein